VTISDAIRTFLEEYTDEAEEAKGIRAIQEIETSGVNEDWDILTQLVKGCAVETGISDLAHQHDHYLYGKPKKE
jgi:hypothetical protein